MKTRWIWGLVIVLSLAGNLVLGATLFGVLHAPKPFHPFSVALRKAKDMPPDERAAIRAVARQESPALRAALKDVKAARTDLAAYVASPGYTHAEAQKRFDDLRAKTARSQIMAQTMFLDMADTLTPQDRANLLDASK